MTLQWGGGGGIAGDALGIGSYEWGFISDNLTYVKFVNPRGEIETVSGLELAKVAGAEGTTGLIVEAGIKLRPKTPTLSFVFHSPSLDEVLKNSRGVLRHRITALARSDKGSIDIKRHD